MYSTPSTEGKAKQTQLEDQVAMNSGLSSINDLMIDVIGGGIVTSNRHFLEQLSHSPASSALST
jgi:hypothetical protein